MVSARKQLTEHIAKLLARKLTGTAIGKAAVFAVPVIGWAVLAWSAWDIYSMAAEAEETIKSKIFESYNTMYSEEVQLVYWVRKSTDYGTYTWPHKIRAEILC